MLLHTYFNFVTANDRFKLCIPNLRLKK